MFPLHRCLTTGREAGYAPAVSPRPRTHLCSPLVPRTARQRLANALLGAQMAGGSLGSGCRLRRQFA